MVEILRSATFDRWLRKLNDSRVVARILVRIDRLALGNPGDVKSVGGGVFELRIDLGPGYRVYFARQDQTLVLLLCGGDKSTQSNDISTAQRIANEWRNDG
ncbi:MAG: type II toxin-antitoxin system RelE/ParE family toxin [Pseudolysinimonas sp.]